MGMNQFSRSIALWLVLGLMFLLLFNIFSRQQPREPEIIFSDFLNQVEKGPNLVCHNSGQLGSKATPPPASTSRATRRPTLTW